MEYIIGTISGLLVAAVFAAAGWYYISSAETLAKAVHEGSLPSKPPFSYLFPSRLHNPKRFVRMFRLCGYAAYTVSLFVVVCTIWNCVSRLRY